MPAWVEQGAQEYAKRLPADCRLELVEIAMSKRGKNTDIAKAIDKEGELMLAAIGKGDRVVALDLSGKSWSTPKLAEQLADWQMDGRHVSLLVGGPDGLAKPCLAKADQKWCLSALTLPHPMVRVIVAEQLYRAWSINHNHPYHR